MQKELLNYLRCPVSKEKLTVQIISTAQKDFEGISAEVIKEGLLFSPAGFIFPIINFIPRLLPGSFIDHKDFILSHYRDYETDVNKLEITYGHLIKEAIATNRRTLNSFSKEWSLYDYDTDKTWDADNEGMLNRFLTETGETRQSLQTKLIFDAGCGNGKLNSLLAHTGATIIGMDLSNSVERAYQKNDHPAAFFLQGDILYPPFEHSSFDIVHSSGVLICTKDPEFSFSALDKFVRPQGKMSVWLYHPRKDLVHNLFNLTRRFTSKLPIGFQYYLYRVTLLPASWIIKRSKGNKQTTNEMMIDIMDWFSPQYRWEIKHDTAKGWFTKRNYTHMEITTNEVFGFNITGVKTNA